MNSSFSELLLDIVELVVVLDIPDITASGR